MKRAMRHTNTEIQIKMIKYTAGWRLHSALGNMGAPMKIINRRSTLFQGVIKEIKYGGLSPDEGAKRVLRAVHNAFDQQASPCK